jgi:RimJ/RimL family protein N-acetyltransferase
MADELRSQRLILRALQSEDAVHIAALLHDDRDAIRRMSHMPDPCTVEAAREWITRRTAPGSATFAIVRATDGVFLGAIGFGSLPEMPGVGYWIGRPYWGQGYATEALRLIVGYARSRGAQGLQAETFPDNPASARVLAKCGFQDRGLGLRDYPARGGLVRVRIHLLHFATHDARADSGSNEGSSS